MGCKLYIYKRVGDGDKKKGSRIKERRKSRKEIR